MDNSFYYLLKHTGMKTVQGRLKDTYSVSKHLEGYDEPKDCYFVSVDMQSAHWTCDCPSMYRLHAGRQSCKHAQLVQFWFAAGAPPKSYTITGDYKNPKFHIYADLSHLQ
jgi:hypothetical protein